MKKVFSIALLLGMLNSNAQQLEITENPVAQKYLLKHYSLKGNVKSVANYSPSNYLMSEELFDVEGKMTSYISYSGMTTQHHYTYDKPKNLISIKQKTGSLPELNYIYQTNQTGEAEFKLYKVGDPLRKFEYKNNLLIKDTSANQFNTQKTYYSYYEYNSKGQIIKLRNYNADDKISSEESYTYENNVVTISGKSYPSCMGCSMYNYEKKNFYNSKGSLIRSTFSTGGKTEETEYKLDEYGNWIWKTGGATRKITYYEKKTEVPVNKTNAATNQMTLLIDENFENNSNKWPIWNNEASSAQIVNGSYRFQVKQSNNYASWLSVPAFAADQSKDFTIETKIFLQSTETGNVNDSYWLLWGIGNGGKDYYAFGIYPSGKCQYGKLVNNVWNGMQGTIFSSAIKTGINSANVLRVEKHKDSLYFVINNSNILKAKYETFLSNYAGIGYQFNNKKVVDIEYLKVFQGTVSNYISSPEPHETNYQKKLTSIRDSKERADALIDYYFAIKQLNYTKEEIETLLGKKLLQMMDIDFHGYYLMLMSKRLNTDDIKMCMKASEVLTKEQRDAVKSLAKYNVDDFVAMQNNTAKPEYPIGVPKPGFGWGKTISSNTNQYTYSETVNTSSAPAKPKVTEAEIKAVIGKFYEGKTKAIYSYFVMKIISYKKKSYGEGFDVDIRIARKPAFNNLVDCELERTTVDAETIFFPTDTYYSELDPYEICKVCNGTKMVKKTFSHTNDYQYTTGTKTTYTATSTSKCIACEPGKYRPMKPLAACIESNRY